MAAWFRAIFGLDSSWQDDRALATSSGGRSGLVALRVVEGEGQSTGTPSG